MLQCLAAFEPLLKRLSLLSLLLFLSTLPAHSFSRHQTMVTPENPSQPVWDPVAQIYVGGVVPENAQVQEMIAQNGGRLRLFGYGSLCWNPGTGALAHSSVKTKLGRARGYRRCWAQKSTDHRGVPRFPGIVCTLLRDEEVRQFRTLDYDEETLTEGLIYEVPPELVEECLAELDFREKGVSLWIGFYCLNGIFSVFVTTNLSCSGFAGESTGIRA